MLSWTMNCTELWLRLQLKKRESSDYLEVCENLTSPFKIPVVVLQASAKGQMTVNTYNTMCQVFLLAPLMKMNRNKCMLKSDKGTVLLG